MRSFLKNWTQNLFIWLQALTVPAKNWPCGFLKLFNYKQTQKHISANQGCKLNFCRTRSSRYLISYNYSRITRKLYFKQNQPARLLTDLETASRFFFNFAFKNERLKELKCPFFVLIQPILPSRGIIICLLSRNPKHMSTSKSNLKHKIISNTEKKNHKYGLTAKLQPRKLHFASHKSIFIFN